MSFSELLIKSRNNKHLSKMEAAKILGWSPMYYGRYENNQLLPTKANIKKFADFIGVSEKELKLLIKKERKESL